MIVKEIIRFVNYDNRALTIYYKGSGKADEKHEIIGVGIIDRDGNILMNINCADVFDKVSDINLRV